MTPLRARLAGWHQHLRCWCDLHEYTTHTQDAQAAAGDAPATPAILQQRCLHCGHLTAGWHLDGPRYKVTQVTNRTQLVLHNPRLTRCPCAGCEQTRAARRAKRKTVTPLRRSA